jgi:thiamine biosynthesis lipoprotein
MKPFRLFIPLLCLLLSACTPKQQETEITGPAQGTTYHIKVVLDEKSLPVSDIERRIVSTLAEIDAQLSNYRDDSEISRLNAQQTTDWLPASREIIDLLVISNQVYLLTDGCYDLTIKPLFDLWGFSAHQNRVPSDQEIADLLPHIGMNLLEIDAANQRIRKIDPNIRIDLSSIAQGYSVGVVAHKLEELGINNYLVEIGGEMMVKGRKANGDDWRVGVEAPTPLSRSVQKVIDIRQAAGSAVMTAGTYRNFFEENGKTYSHIMNPKTGRPVTHHLRSVTIMHEDAAWADAWDTALLCVGEKEATRIAEENHLKALLIYDEDGKLKEYMSSDFVAAQ